MSKEQKIEETKQSLRAHFPKMEDKTIDELVWSIQAGMIAHVRLEQ